MNNEFFFPGVTLLITHYNRSGSLERLLTTFHDLGCRFDDIVVADDASIPEHLEKLKTMQAVFNYRLIEATKNSGFPGNINKGQDAVLLHSHFMCRKILYRQTNCLSIWQMPCSL